LEIVFYIIQTPRRERSLIPVMFPYSTLSFERYLSIRTMLEGGGSEDAGIPTEL
jgi:hypothetical protein